MAIQKSTLIERFWRYVSPEPNSGCWLWTGADSGSGYGVISDGDVKKYAHRISYEMFICPIPTGTEIDHLCRVTFCVNPQHLEAVTHADNVRRGVAGDEQKAKTHCPSGHEYTSENTYTFRCMRYCRTCHRSHVRANDLKRRAKH